MLKGWLGKTEEESFNGIFEDVQFLNEIWFLFYFLDSFHNSQVIAFFLDC